MWGQGSVVVVVYLTWVVVGRVVTGSWVVVVW
jgi:hypothetical protein